MNKYKCAYCDTVGISVDKGLYTFITGTTIGSKGLVEQKETEVWFCDGDCYDSWLKKHNIWPHIGKENDDVNEPNDIQGV